MTVRSRCTSAPAPALVMQLASMHSCACLVATSPPRKVQLRALDARNVPHDQHVLASRAAQSGVARHLQPRRAVGFSM
jgi:hypothetical protein